MTDKPTVREKAFYILGMYRAYQDRGWPRGFDIKRRNMWVDCNHTAFRIACSLKFTQEESDAVVALYDSLQSIEGASNAF
jgi:hypothetical protein